MLGNQNPKPNTREHKSAGRVGALVPLRRLVSASEPVGCAASDFLWQCGECQTDTWGGWNKEPDHTWWCIRRTGRQGMLRHYWIWAKKHCFQQPFNLHPEDQPTWSTEKKEKFHFPYNSLYHLSLSFSPSALVFHSPSFCPPPSHCFYFSPSTPLSIFVSVPPSLSHSPLHLSSSLPCVVLITLWTTAHTVTETHKTADTTNLRKSAF